MTTHWSLSDSSPVTFMVICGHFWATNWSPKSRKYEGNPQVTNLRKQASESKHSCPDPARRMVSPAPYALRRVRPVGPSWRFRARFCGTRSTRLGMRPLAPFYWPLSRRMTPPRRLAWPLAVSKSLLSPCNHARVTRVTNLAVLPQLRQPLSPASPAGDSFCAITSAVVTDFQPASPHFVAQNGPPCTLTLPLAGPESKRA